MLIKVNTVMMLSASDSAEKNPTADSNVNISRIRACRMAGRGSKRDGRGGMPIDIEDREKNTVIWYTSYCMSNDRDERGD
jgi:hypothetical protein